MHKNKYITLFVILTLFMAGCTIERTLKLDARLSLPPAINKIPLHIGVYYNPNFIEYTPKFQLIACGPNGRKDESGLHFIFPVGVASRDLFDQCISSMFASVVLISDPKQFASQVSFIDGWVEPKIESFNWEMECTSDYFSTGRLTASIVYSVNLYNSDGHLVTSIKSIGTSVEHPELCFQNCKDSIVTEQAIRDGMAKFMIDFYERPEAQQWASSHTGVKGCLK